MRKGTSGSRGTTVLGTPATTSYGLFHQQPERANAWSHRSLTSTAVSGRESRSSASSHVPRRHRRTIADGKAKNLAETSTSAAPAFEAAAVSDESSSAVTNKKSNELLELHTSAAKDGVIDMLTAKASKLGVSLERSLLARREIEDGAHKLQGLLDAETARRNDLEYLLQQKQAITEASATENGHLKWEVDALRIELKDAEDRSKGCIQEEVERRRAAEEALAREHAVALAYLEGVYQQGDAPKIGEHGRTTTADVLVRELQALGEALREREGELGACAGRLDEAECDAKAERTRRETIQEQLVFTQERFEVAKRKVRQLSGQLEVEVGDNEALRSRLHAMEEDNELRTRSLQERKVKAQQRKRGDTRDMMAESKAKDDRIKALESSLMQERARLEGELQTARSDYEEAAKESRRKAARLQRRCLELEYRVATAQSKGPETKVGGKNAPPTSLTFSSASTGGSRNNFGIASRGGISLREEGRASVGESGGRDGLDGLAENGVDVTTGLISASSMLPWRRNAPSGETATPTPAATASPLERGSGTSGSSAATTDAKRTSAAGRGRGRVGRRESEAPAQQSKRVVDSGGVGHGSRSSAASVGSAPPPPAQGSSFPGARRSLSSSSSSADRLPDPSRHNESAPAWMRSDLSVDRVRID